jgi:cell division protein FtsI/penicillin-binding protein 2
MSIRHTSPVHRIRRMIAGVGVIGLLGSPVRLTCQTWQNAVHSAALQEPAARVVVLDIASGKILAANQLSDAARTLAAPGSTLKPLVLYALVSAGKWNPANRVACNRQLVVAGHRLACTHPLSPPFDARQALTWSCNSYFAAVARTLPPGELGELLRPTGLLAATGLARPEAVAEFREPQSANDAQLTLLGVQGVRVTPLELAAAYRWLALELAAHPDSEAAQVVRAGLEDSASFGMAGQASLGGVPVLGKTGTADSEASGRSHGWFAGIAPAQKPSVVVAVYLPAARGADAAHVAGEILSHAPLEQP